MNCKTSEDAGGIAVAGRRGGNWIIVLIVAVMLGWPAYQLYGLYNSHSGKHQAGYLLYQVAFFQMELLNHYMGEAGKAAETSQLEGLKQAAYSAAYTHERLVLAYGKGRLAELQSVPLLLQYLLRLEIGGQRPLRPEESQTLQELGKMFKAFYADYAKLLDSDKNVTASQNGKLAKTDLAMAVLLRKKQLE
jgi:hypothetical protein